MGVHGDSVRSVVSAASVNLGGAGSHVHWITISNTHATASTAVELNDSTDDSGTDRWGVIVETSADRDVLPFHAVFATPIEMKTGIYLDITGGTVQVTVGLT